MDETRSNAVWIEVAMFLLALPLLYVGSYLALVTPGKFGRVPYLLGGRKVELFFSPLERIDRAIRPDAWVPNILDLEILDSDWDEVRSNP